MRHAPPPCSQRGSGGTLLPGVLTCALFSFVAESPEAQMEDEAPAPRMGAFQCLVCAEGGGLVGILPTHGRGRREFDGFQELCVSDYRYIDGELYVRFKLEGKLWPDDGQWTVQASSWEAVCRKAF